MFCMVTLSTQSHSHTSPLPCDIDMNFNVCSSSQHPVNNNNNNNTENHLSVCCCCCCWQHCFNSGGALQKSPELQEPQPNSLNTILGHSVLNMFSSAVFSFVSLFSSSLLPIITYFHLRLYKIYITCLSRSWTLDFIYFHSLFGGGQQVPWEHRDISFHITMKATRLISV